MKLNVICFKYVAANQTNFSKITDTYIKSKKTGLQKNYKGKLPLFFCSYLFRMMIFSVRGIYTK